MRYFTEVWTRSLVKAVTYRICILILDFSAVYFFTGKMEIAIAFMLISNVYTTAGYYLHERLWDRVAWANANYSFHQ